jgi:hypothetical protein
MVPVATEQVGGIVVLAVAEGGSNGGEEIVTLVEGGDSQPELRLITVKL